MHGQDDRASFHNTSYFPSFKFLGSSQPLQSGYQGVFLCM